MRLLLLHKLIEPLLEERFRLKFVEGLPTHIARHYLKNDVLLRFHEDQKNIRLNVFDYLWVLLVLMGREIGTPLSLFPTIKEKIDFQDLIFRYLTTRENTIVMVKYPNNDVTVGVIEENQILVEEDEKLLEVPLSDIISTPTLIFPIKDMVKQFISIMIDQKRINDLRELVMFRDGEVQLVQDMVSGNVKTVNGEKIKKDDVEGVIDIILNNTKRDIIEYTTKEGKTIKVNTPIITSVVKKKLKGNPFYVRKTTEEITKELIKE